jgi:hypothetical protein
MWTKPYRVAHDENSVKGMLPSRQPPNLLKECVHKARKENIRILC